MEELNYFTGKFSKSGLVNHFGSLDENKLKYELENFTNQYLKLSEEKQLKYVEYVLNVCNKFEKQFDKTIEKKFLESISGIILKTQEKFEGFLISYYLDILFHYMFKVNKTDDYLKFFEKNSSFFDIISLVVVDGKNWEDYHVVSPILAVFCQVLTQSNLPSDFRIQLEKEINSFINFLYKNYDLKNFDYWYFQLDELVSIFRFEHLKKINKYFMENPQSENVGEYLDFVSRHFENIIEESIDVVRKIAEENDSDIIRSKVIKILKRYDHDILNEKSDLDIILSLDTNELLKQADEVIYYIRSKLTVNAKDLTNIGSFGHYTKIDTLTNYLIKADWKNENDSKAQPPYLRLTNLKQLNDPMEGRAIYDYLGMDNTFLQKYQTSNVFISSLSIVSDSLPMWKEYADSSQGAFLEYDMTYLENIVAHKSIEFVKVHYLDLMPDNKDKSDVDKSLDSLKQIFEKLQELEDKEALIGFADKLKKISYLFKVKDYEYEMEYRILINLDDTAIQNIINKDTNDSSNEKHFKKEEIRLEVFDKVNYNDFSLKKEGIGLEIFDKVNYNDFRKYIVLSPKDNGRYDLFVYINLAPLKYSKVILGPKVTDADYIAPYLKLANPDIEIESSKIPYR